MRALDARGEAQKGVMRKRLPVDLLIPHAETLSSHALGSVESIKRYLIGLGGLITIV
jgi:hypothetical protein